MFGRLPRPTPSMLVATTAVVLSLCSTAWAATMIFSSNQIKDDVILSRDIHNNTLRGEDVQDGTLGAGELTQNAADALRGPTGKTGPVGERGPAGRRGPVGDTILSSVTYARTTVTVGPVSSAAAQAVCPKRLVVIGGGVTETSGKSVVTSSGPLGRKAWRVSLSNGDALPHEATVTAICVQAKKTN